MNVSITEYKDFISVCFSGISIGVELTSSAIHKLLSFKLNKKSAPAFPPRNNSSSFSESTLTLNPACCNSLTVSSKCGNGVSGKQPISIMSAPSNRRLSARVKISSTLIIGASTISAKITTSCLLKSTGLQSLPKKAGKSFISIVPRMQGTPISSESFDKSPRQRPGTMSLSILSKSVIRRAIICAVINAATLTPILRISNVNSVGDISFRILSRRFWASLPVRKRMFSFVILFIAVDYKLA